METRYLTLSELIYINGTLLKTPDITSGKRQVRDIDLLEAAVARPSSSAFGQDAYPTLRQKAAALLHSLARNHPFADGNKRTATVGVIFMLEVNGQTVIWEQENALAMMLRVAEGKAIEVDDIAAWLPLTEHHHQLPPDSEADMQLIARIIDEQKWLLDELERQ
ncbi:MAG TPA: type II toxin-antitoxin system death-on-curing family toxin [Phototrophicaceae bacterium]|nr:type II toxin-antitoxin system death-on-curing family toxin [Phototrophicaceae bacterium]